MKNNAHLTALRAALESEAISEDARDLIEYAIDDYDVYETPRDLIKALEDGDVVIQCFGSFYLNQEDVNPAKIVEEAVDFVETFGYGDQPGGPAALPGVNRKAPNGAFSR